MYFTNVQAPPGTYFYKYPVVYFFDPSMLPDNGSLYDADYFNSTPEYVNITDRKNLLSSYYPEIPVDTRLAKNMIDYRFFNTEPDNISYDINSLLVPGDRNLSPSIINGVLDSGSIYQTNTELTWVLKGDNTSVLIMEPGLTINKNYILGIAPQLNMLKADEYQRLLSPQLKRKHGSFIYKDILFAPSIKEYKLDPPKIISLNFGRLVV